MRQIQFKELEKNINILQDVILQENDSIIFRIKFDRVTTAWFVSEMLGNEIEPFCTYRAIGITMSSPLDTIKKAISNKNRYVDTLENGVYYFDNGEITFGFDRQMTELQPYMEFQDTGYCEIFYRLKSLPKYEIRRN